MFSIRSVEYTFSDSIRCMSIRFVSIRCMSIRFVKYTFHEYTVCKHTFCKCILIINNESLRSFLALLNVRHIDISHYRLLFGFFLLNTDYVPFELVDSTALL
jgi:hypothetical protein